MDRILIIMKKKNKKNPNGLRALSAPLLELFSIIFKHVYWFIQQISGERLQDHWSSGYICENKGADQLHSNCEADQCLCFRYTDSTISLLLKSETCFFYCTGRYVSDLVRNPEDRFSRVAAHIHVCTNFYTVIAQKDWSCSHYTSNIRHLYKL